METFNFFKIGKLVSTLKKIRSIYNASHALKYMHLLLYEKNNILLYI